ncbi:hypothetical protein HDU96_000768, partial [Phlyctochytrium bullatum]
QLPDFHPALFANTLPSPQALYANPIDMMAVHHHHDIVTTTSHPLHTLYMTSPPITPVFPRTTSFFDEPTSVPPQVLPFHPHHHPAFFGLDTTVPQDFPLPSPAIASAPAPPVGSVSPIPPATPITATSPVIAAAAELFHMAASEAPAIVPSHASPAAVFGHPAGAEAAFMLPSAGRRFSIRPDPEERPQFEMPMLPHIPQYDAEVDEEDEEEEVEEDVQEVQEEKEPEPEPEPEPEQLPEPVPVQAPIEESKKRGRKKKDAPAPRRNSDPFPTPLPSPARTNTTTTTTRRPAASRRASVAVIPRPRSSTSPAPTSPSTAPSPAALLASLTIPLPLTASPTASTIAAAAVAHAASEGRKAFACPFRDCERTFPRQYNLKSHIYCHTGERPHGCATCGAAFARKHDLQRHLRTLHAARRGSVEED